MSSKASRQSAPQKPGAKKQKPNQQAPRTPQLQQQTQEKARTAPANLDLAAKKEARLQRQEAARIAGARRRRRAAMRRTAIFAAIGLVLLGTIVALYMREANKPGERVTPMAERNHLGPGQLYTGRYSTDPPTSGPHTESVPAFKIHTEPITKELQVHGLEDGGVIIHYKPDLDKPTVDRLGVVATSYLEQRGGRSHVILAPYPDLSHPIVLTAWGRIDRLDAFDEARIRRFIDEYVGIDHHEGREGQRIP